jgi:hypothetical protein
MSLTAGDETCTQLWNLLEANLRLPVQLGIEDTTGAFVATFDPPLDGGEQVIFDQLAAVAASPVNVSLDQWQSREADIAALVAFQTASTPTLAETVAAVRANARLLLTDHGVG